MSSRPCAGSGILAGHSCCSRCTKCSHRLSGSSSCHSIGVRPRPTLDLQVDGLARVRVSPECEHNSNRNDRERPELRQSERPGDAHVDPYEFNTKPDCPCQNQVSRKHDLAVSRLIAFDASRSLELRVETFNLFNTLNWGPPTLSQGGDRTLTNFSSGAFGRITSIEGTLRIMQFGVRYGF